MKPEKVRYRFFFFRPSSDIPNFELEAGPFTPLEASAFGQMETAKKTMATGETWGCHYQEIVAYDTGRRPLWIGVVIAICSIVIGLILGDFLARTLR